MTNVVLRLARRAFIRNGATVGAFAVAAALFVQGEGCGGTSFVCAFNTDSVCAFPAENSCGSHSGCQWITSCGYPLCGGNTVTEEQCATMSGCDWVQGLGCALGANLPNCLTFPTEPDCTTRVGCRWEPQCRPNPAQNCSDAATQSACENIGFCRWVRTGPATLG